MDRSHAQPLISPQVAALPAAYLIAVALGAITAFASRDAVAQYTTLTSATTVAAGSTLTFDSVSGRVVWTNPPTGTVLTISGTTNVQGSAYVDAGGRDLGWNNGSQLAASGTATMVFGRFQLQASGTFSVTDNAWVTSASYLSSGAAGVNIFRANSGAIINQSGGVFGGYNENIYGLSTFNISGGLHVNGGGAAGTDKGFGQGGLTTFNMTGGETRFGGMYVNSSGVAFNLGNAALMSMTAFSSGNSGTATTNFDGGTIRALSSQTTTGFFTNATGVTFVNNVQAGGVSIDTNSFNANIGTALVAGTTPGGGLAKLGAGTLTLSAANTFTGATTVRNGTLTLDFAATTAPATNILATSSSLALGGGTLNLAGKASTSNSQTVNGLVVNPGASAITLTANATSNPLLLALGGITRNAGGTLNLTQPTGTLGTTNGATTSTADSSGILGGWFTVGGSDWATNNGTNIVTYAGYTNDTWAAGTNTTVTNDSSLADATTNSLRFNAAGARTLTLAGTNTVESGGILVTSAVGNNATSIIGGVLRGSSSGDLVVINNNTSNSTTISSVIADNGSATALTKSGSGTLILGGVNTYTGKTFVNSGTLSVATIGNGGVAGGLGASSADAANLVLDGATLRYTGSGETTNRGLTLTGRGATLDAAGTGALTISGSIVLQTNNLNRTLTLTGTNTDSNTLSSSIGDSLSGVTSITKSGAGRWVLSGSNTFTGTTTHGAGTLVIGNQHALRYSTLVMSATGALFDGAAGTAFTLGGLSGGSNLSLLNTSGNPVTLTVGGGGPVTTFNATYSGILSGAGGSLTKVGRGKLTLSGNNTYTGTTTIAEGILSVNTIGNGGTAGALGQASADAANLVLDGGVLQYTGTTASTNRNITIGPKGGWIDSSAGGNALTMTGSFAFSSVNTPQSVNFGGTGTGANTFAGAISDNGTGAVTVTKWSGLEPGAGGSATDGVWVLTGANTYTGGTKLLGGTLAFANGSLGTTGNIETLGNSTLRWHTGNTQDISGRLTVTTTNRPTLAVDPTANAVTFENLGAFDSTISKTGTGTLKIASVGSNVRGVLVEAGTLEFSGSTTNPAPTMTIGADRLSIRGNTALFTMSGGTLTLNSQIRLGNDSAVGVMQFSSGTINHAADILDLGFNGGRASMTLSGTAIYNGSGRQLRISNAFESNSWVFVTDTASGTFAEISLADANGVNGTSQFGTVIVSGSGSLSGSSLVIGKTITNTSSRGFGQFVQQGGTTTISGAVELGRSQAAGTTLQGTLNLDGGTLRVGDRIFGGTGSSYVNFHGGTLAYSGSTTKTNFIDLGVTGKAFVYDSSTIDIGAQAVTIAQALQTPNIGSGLSSVTLTNAGSGYTVAPGIRITGGGGEGATAIATIGTNGALSITVTNPGTGYTSSPTILLERGHRNGGVDAVVGTVSVATNAYTGGITKQGAGRLTLTAANTFTGPTVIGAGTLALSGLGTHGAGNLSLGTSGIFELAALTASTYTLPSTASLVGNGTISGGGLKTLAVPGILAPGNGTGTITLDSTTLQLASSTISNFEINSLVDFDKVIGAGTGSQVVYGGTLNLAFDPLGSFSAGNSFQLFSIGSSLAGSGSFGPVNSTGLSGGLTASFDGPTGTVLLVPEPGTLAVLGMGAALAVAWRARRRRA